MRESLDSIDVLRPKTIVFVLRRPDKTLVPEAPFGAQAQPAPEMKSTIDFLSNAYLIVSIGLKTT